MSAAEYYEGFGVPLVSVDKLSYEEPADPFGEPGWTKTGEFQAYLQKLSAEKKIVAGRPATATVYRLGVDLVDGTAPVEENERVFVTSLGQELKATEVMQYGAPFSLALVLAEGTE